MTQVSAVYKTENDEIEVHLTGRLEFTSDNPNDGVIIDIEVDDVVIFGKSVDWSGWGIGKDLRSLADDVEFE